MALKGRSFITTQDFPTSDLEAMLVRAKALKHATTYPQTLAGKSIALLFFNASMRTRVTFELAITHLGGTALTMNVGTDSWSLEHRDGVVMNEGKTEHIKDAAKVLSRYVDAIGVRCFPTMEKPEEDLADAVIMAFKRHAEVPVINLESSLFHPCQAMADMMTIQEKKGTVKGQRVVLTWAPHPKALPTAVPNSFLLAASQLGADVVLAHPKEFPLPGKIVEQAQHNAKASGRMLRIVDNQPEAFLGAQVVYAKSWGSIGYYGKWSEETKVRTNYGMWKIDEPKMRSIPEAIFMHCLPIRRNVEASDAVLDSRQSVIYDEAENRLWAQMALLEALI
jgi:N-acetylornithine carbamoyltransferase